jgi:RNA polymerase sigma-70 factor (subfamily 1)
VNTSRPSIDRTSLPDLGRSIELVHEFQAGRETALNELFSRYRDRVRRIVGVRMGAALRAVMEEDDIVQEVFLVAARRIGEFEPQSHASILGWLAAIAENKLREKAKFHTREKRDARMEVPFASPEDTSSSGRAPEAVAAGPSPSQESAWIEVEGLVDSCLSKLEPDVYREAILQRDYYGGTWDELQTALDRPTVAAVQELYRRAHAKLREDVMRRMKS